MGNSLLSLLRGDPFLHASLPGYVTGSCWSSSTRSLIDRIVLGSSSRRSARTASHYDQLGCSAHGIRDLLSALVSRSLLADGSIGCGS